MSEAWVLLKEIYSASAGAGHYRRGGHLNFCRGEGRVKKEPDCRVAEW